MPQFVARSGEAKLTAARRLYHSDAIKIKVNAGTQPHRATYRRIIGLSVVKDIRAGETDICAGEMDFHVHVIGRCGRIDVKDRLIVRAVREPADTVCRYGVGRTDWPLHVSRACDG